MGRQRIHFSAAERQKAYRLRMLTPKPPPAPVQKKIRQPSRPKQLAEIDEKIQSLFASYEDWRGQIPESLEGSSQAYKLADTCDKLSTIIDLLADIDPPLGFGRD